MSFRGMETSMQDGVFYQIVSSGLKTVCEDEFWEQKDTIAVIDAHKLENSQSFGQFCCGCSGGEYIRGCRVIQDKSHTLIEWHVPEKRMCRGICSFYNSRKNCLYTIYRLSRKSAGTYKYVSS